MSVDLEALEARLADAKKLREELATFRAHSVTLNSVAWTLAEALEAFPDGAKEVMADAMDLAERAVAEIRQLRDQLAVSLGRECGALCGDVERDRDVYEAEVRQLRGANTELAISNDALTFMANAKEAELRQLRSLIANCSCHNDACFATHANPCCGTALPTEEAR